MRGKIRGNARIRRKGRGGGNKNREVERKM